MKLSKAQQEKLVLVIQGAIGAAVIFMTACNAAKVQNAQQKKFARQNAKAFSRLQKKEYRMKTRLMKEKYRGKISRARQSSVNGSTRRRH